MRSRVLAAGILGALVAGPTTAATVEAATIEDLVAGMTRREKAAQVVMAPIYGTGFDAADRALVRDLGLGAVILFRANYRDAEQLRRLTRAIQTAARNSDAGVGALIAADQEGGVVERFPDLAPSYGAPDANTLARARRMGSTTGFDLRRVGVNMNLAPVADLDRGPTRMMRLRAFGRQPDTVRARVGAYLDGLLGTGVGAAVKHFPGIGAASANTDDMRVVIRLSREEIAVDGTPFEVAAGRARAAVMVSNAVYPAYQARVPASVSRPTYRRLRELFGKDTLAVTDALGPIAWAFGGVVAKACPSSIRAGADVALLAGDAATTRDCVERIVDAHRAGRISSARLDAAVTNVLRYKRAVGVL